MDGNMRVLLAVLVFGTFVSALAEESMIEDVDLSTLDKSIQGMQCYVDSRFENYERIIAAHSSKFASMEQIINNQADTIATQTEAIENQAGAILKLQELHRTNVQESSDNPNLYQLTEYGCQGDILSLNCSDGRTINITSAYYSKYATAGCGLLSCCVPHPGNDCKEDMETVQEEDYLDLIYECQNQTSCSYECRSAIMNDCAATQESDYVQIFYSCLPEPEDEPIGFTAYSLASNLYASGKVVNFRSALNNFGSYYNPQASTFICPRHGIYMFSVSYNTHTSYHSTVDIMVDNIAQAGAWADNDPDGYNQASASIVIECESGQVVWVEARYDDTYLADYGRNNIFSGYMLYGY